MALTLDTGDGVGGGRYVVDKNFGSSRIGGIDDYFDWEFLPDGQSPIPPVGFPSLLAEAPDGSAALQCWEGHTDARFILDGEERWLTAGFKDHAVNQESMEASTAPPLTTPFPKA